MGSPTIFNGTAVKLLKSILKFFNGTQIQSGSGDPTSVGVDGTKGDIYISTATGFSYQKNDSGVTTNWTQVGTYDVTDFTLANMTDIASASVPAFYVDAAGFAGLNGGTSLGLSSDGLIQLTTPTTSTNTADDDAGNVVQTIVNTVTTPAFTASVETSGDTYNANNHILLNASSCDTLLDNDAGYVDSFIASNAGIIQGQFYASTADSVKHAEVTIEHVVSGDITHAFLLAQDSTATATFDVNVNDSIARVQTTAETSYAAKVNNNETLLTELVYGFTQQSFTGTAPLASVAIDSTKSGDILYIRNSTISTINFIQKTAETFNGASNINLLAGKTAQFVQFAGDGVYTVFIGP